MRNAGQIADGHDGVLLSTPSLGLDGEWPPRWSGWTRERARPCPPGADDLWACSAWGHRAWGRMGDGGG